MHGHHQLTYYTWNIFFKDVWDPGVAVKKHDKRGLVNGLVNRPLRYERVVQAMSRGCLLYTSDAADE